MAAHRPAADASCGRAAAQSVVCNQHTSHVVAHACTHALAHTTHAEVYDWVACHECGRQAHYPETMHKAYILNAPKIFALIWKIIKPVLADRVVARIVIATDSREEELRKLLRYGESSIRPIPAHTFITICAYSMQKIVRAWAGPNTDLPWSLVSAAKAQTLSQMLDPVMT